MTPQRIILVVAGIAAAVALFVLVRPDDEETSSAPRRPSVTSSVHQEPRPETIRITVRDGAPVSGVAHPEIARGERVKIVVRADVADHVHLHGYDLIRDVAPGAPAQLVLTADVTGVFELELEESGILLAELEVAP